MTNLIPTAKQLILMVALSPIVTILIAWVIKSLKRLPSDALGFIRAITGHIIA